MKTFIMWFLTTFILYILLATVVMFSRQTTLHGVRVLDFDIFSRSISRFNKEKRKIDFKYIADILTFNIGKENEKILFPVAILDNNSCIENGSKVDTICGTYKSAKYFTSIMKKIKPRDKYGRKIYDFDNGESYLYKKLDNNTILVGQTGKYLIKSNLKSLKIFLRDDWSNFFTTWKGSPGRYGGIKLTWKKTKGIFYITFVVSFMMYLLYTLYFRARAKEYSNLKNKSLQTDQILFDLNNEFTLLLQQKIEIENSIAELVRDDLLSESEHTKEKIKLLKQSEQNLQDLLTKKKQEIISAEHIEDKIKDDIKKQVDKVNSTKMLEEIELLIDKLHNIKKLWQRELTWNERKVLEGDITGFEQNIPFTISQSFILFEKEIVLKLAKTCRGYSDSMGLLEMINLISDNKNFDEEIKGKLHRIRKARNQWSHVGKLPSNEIIDDLLSILHSFEVEPNF